MQSDKFISTVLRSIFRRSIESTVVRSSILTYFFHISPVSGSSFVYDIIIYLYYLIFVDLCQSTLVIRPNNYAVIRGTNATLQCSTSESGSVRWLRILPKHKEPLVIYRNFTVHGDKSIYHVDDSTDHRFNLVVNTRAPESHGLFVCEDGTKGVDPVNVERAGAEVIVIGEEELIKIK